MLVPTSFRPYVPLVGITGGFTVRHYTKLVTDSYYLEIIGRTLGLGLTVTALTLVIGYPVAFFLARTRSRWRGWLTILVVFPLLLNLVVRTFGWIALLAQNGLVNQAMIALGLVHAPGRAPVQLRRAPHRAHAHLPAVHGAGARRRHPEHPARRRGRGARPGRLLGRRLRPGHAAAVPAGRPVGVDPRLRPDHQRARDAAPARRPDLPGDVHADLRRVPAAPQLAGGVRPGPAAHRDGARAGLPLGPRSPGGRERACERGPCARVAPASVGDARLRLPPAARRRRGARVVQPHVVSHRAAARA